MHTDAGWQPVFKRQIIVQSEGSPHNTGKNQFTATLILHFPKWKISNFEIFILKCWFPQNLYYAQIHRNVFGTV